MDESYEEDWEHRRRPASSRMRAEIPTSWTPDPSSTATTAAITTTTARQSRASTRRDGRNDKPARLRRQSDTAPLQITTLTSHSATQRRAHEGRYRLPPHGPTEHGRAYLSQVKQAFDSSEGEDGFHSSPMATTAVIKTAAGRDSSLTSSTKPKTASSMSPTVKSVRFKRQTPNYSPSSSSSSSGSEVRIPTTADTTPTAVDTSPTRITISKDAAGSVSGVRISQTELERRMQALRESISERQQHRQSAPQRRQQQQQPQQTSQQQQQQQQQEQQEQQEQLQQKQQQQQQRKIDSVTPHARQHMASIDRVSSSSAGGQSDNDKVRSTEGVGISSELALSHPQTLHNRRSSSDAESASSATSGDIALSLSRRSYPMDSMQREIQRLRMEFEQSQFEARQLQQWIMTRENLGLRQPLDAHSRSFKAKTEKSNINNGRNGSSDPRNTGHYDHYQRQRTHWNAAFPFSSTTNNQRSSREMRKARSMVETRESSESDTSSIDNSNSDGDNGSDIEHWSKRSSSSSKSIGTGQNTRSRRRGSAFSSSTDDSSSSTVESEYRDPFGNSSAHSARVAAAYKNVLERRGRRRGLCMRFIRRFVWVVFWGLVFLVVQVVIMGLLFRPNAALNEALAVHGMNSPRIVGYRGRDYVAGQVGFYTVLNDGFGADTLAYCHDLWEFPNDAQSHGSPLLLLSTRLVDQMLTWIVQGRHAVHDSAIGVGKVALPYICSLRVKVGAMRERRQRISQARTRRLSTK